MWKIDPKDKHIHKNKHYHIQNHLQNIFVIVELRERGKGKENNRVLIS
jgi:hypothetical protein